MRIIRGSTLSFAADSFLREEAECLRYEEDAAIVVENGKVTRVGEAGKILASLALIARRMQCADSLAEALFIQMILGDDRAVRAAHSGGRLVYRRRGVY